MQNLIVSSGVLAKLRDKHAISIREIEQCFENKCGMYVHIKTAFDPDEQDIAFYDRHGK